MDTIDFNQKVISLITECNKTEEYKLSSTLSYEREISDYLLEEDEDYDDLVENSKDLKGNNFPFHLSDEQKYQLTEENIILLPWIGKLVDNSKSLTEDDAINFGRMIDQNLNFGRNLSDFRKDKYYYFNLLIQSSKRVNLLMNDGEKIDKRYFDVLWSKEMVFEGDGKKNFKQEIGLETKKFLHVVFCKTEKSDVLQKKNILETFLFKHQLFNLIFHEPTFIFLNERKYQEHFNRTKVLCQTFYWWMITHLKPVDRMRYLLAGSLIKSTYGLRDAKDVDFFVLDHEDNIEKYSSFKPDIGIKGYFDDFGKTYYGNEKFYNPMIPKYYKEQQEKRQEEIEEEELTVLTNYPKYSVSGLKAGRYFNIFQGELEKIGIYLKSMDDLVFNPKFKVYYLGMPIIQLKIELVRDMIKGIDLGRISKKQLYDLKYLRENYGHLFNKTEKDELGLNKTFNENKIKIDLNIYHDKTEKGSCGVLITKTPLYMIEITKKLIDDGPMLFIECEKEPDLDYRRIIYNPMLSSLIEKTDKGVKLEYHYNLDLNGQFVIYCCELEGELNKILVDKFVVGGIITVQEDDERKKIRFSVNHELNKRVCNGNKKYKIFLMNFMKNIIQMHKLIDCQTKKKMITEFQT